MVILSVKDGETIRIEDEIELTVILIRNDRLRLGVRCSRSVVANQAEPSLRRDRTRASTDSKE